MGAPLRAAALIAAATCAAAAQLGSSDDDHGGVFPCLAGHSGGLATTIPAGHVNDTVCDCCDCSDETGGRADEGGACPARLMADRGLLRAYAAAADKGAAATAKAMLKPDRARALYESLHRELDAAVKRAQALERQLQSEGQRLQAMHSARKPISAGALAAFQRQQEAYRASSAGALQLQAAASVDFGPNRRLLTLLAAGCAVSAPLNEKRTKGGSTTSTPKTYAYVVCPFANVTQVEVAPDGWLRAEAASRGEAAAAAAAEEGVASVGADGAVESLPAAGATAAARRRGAAARRAAAAAAPPPPCGWWAAPRRSAPSGATCRCRSWTRTSSAAGPTTPARGVGAGRAGREEPPGGGSRSS